MELSSQNEISFLKLFIVSPVLHTGSTSPVHEESWSMVRLLVFSESRIIQEADIAYMPCY